MSQQQQQESQTPLLSQKLVEASQQSSTNTKAKTKAKKRPVMITKQKLAAQIIALEAQLTTHKPKKDDDIQSLVGLINTWSRAGADVATVLAAELGGVDVNALLDSVSTADPDAVRMIRHIIGS